MKKIKFLLMISWALFIFSACRSNSEKNKDTAKVEILDSSEVKNFDFTNLDIKVISHAKNQIQRENSTYVAAYEKLIKNANRSMNEGPFSVVNKTQTPISGDKHDYLSLGPYWWPDPAKKDGLPWIRKDGEINPLTRGENVDEPRKDKMFSNTYNLGLAFYFSDDQKYADKAIGLLETWFINPETKMNPNLNYAQGIPGINNGRGIGIIEFTGITNIITTIELLEYKNVLDAVKSRKLREWLSDYLNWLQTSENGIFESKTKNNHGTWYDVQLVSILRFLDREKEAKEVLENVKLNRIATQILADGKQPHELARTKSLSYSTMNLKGFTVLADHGKKMGVDLWNYDPEGAGSIKDAYNFLYFYAKGTKKWQSEQLSDINKATKSLKDLFVLAGGLFNNKEYCAVEGDINILLHSCDIQN